MADGNYFAGKHEVKFGFSWKKAPVDSISALPGSKIWADHASSYAQDGLMYATLNRDWAQNTEGQYMSAYVGDTISLDRMTINGAFRWDRSTSSVTESTVAGIPGLENILPGVTAAAVKDAIVYNTVSPRVGITYALTEDRKTLVRTSYAMFASQLGAADAGIISAIQYSGIYYYAYDLNGNGTAEPNEIRFDLGALGYYGFDPANPSSLTSVNKVDPNVSSPKTHEFLVGIDHELMPNFAVSGNFTYRRFVNRTWQPIIGVRAPDYFLDSTLTGSVEPVGAYSVPVYGIDASVLPPGAGKEFTNRQGYHQRYWGIELSATKRMSNRWMARVGFSTNDHREYFDDPNTSICDPTPDLAITGGQTGPLVDGGLVVRNTSGSGKSSIYMVLPRYQMSANGLYQGPWGLNFGANLVMRQGYVMPYNQTRVRANDPSAGTKTVLLVKEVDQFRLPTVATLDFRIQKDFRVSRANFILDLDVFNLFNSATVLGQEYDARLSAYNQVREIMNPRIARVGLRITF